MSTKGYKYTDEQRKNMSASAKISMNRPEVKAKRSASMKGYKYTPEQRKKMSASMKGNRNHWKGGCDVYFHEKAKELFGSPICQDCNISLKIYRNTHKHHNFDMHCCSTPKDYTILEQWNWRCVCSKCHSRIEKELKNKI